MRNLALAALIALAAPAAHAQALAPGAAPDAARTAAASDLVTLLDVRGQMRRAMAKQIAEMRTGAAFSRPLEQNPQFKIARSKNPQQFDQVFRKVGAIQADAADRVLKEAEPEAVRATVNAYARNFGAAELRQLIAFYQTPLGATLRERLPAVTQETQSALADKLAPRMQDEMRKLGPQIQAELRRLAPAPPPARAVPAPPPAPPAP